MRSWLNTVALHLNITLKGLMHIALYVALLCAMATVAGAAGRDMDHGSTALLAQPATPVAPPVQDDTEDHDLFHPSATLDTRQIDDLRSTPEAQCLVTGGVMTPERQCVDGVAVWWDEMGAETWKHLKAIGYVRSIAHSEPGDPALWIPAEMVILGGEHGDDVLAVEPCRPLTPRV